MRHRRALLFALALGSFAAAAWAGSPVNKSYFGGVAIEGYDAVAYFEENRPVEGKKEFSYDWKGATWRFASAARRDLFAAAPEKYAPQYGGYCAWAVSQGYTAGIDPEAWKIHEGKLYLNYDREVQAKWSKDIPGNIARANENWPGLSGER